MLNNRGVFSSSSLCLLNGDKAHSISLTHPTNLGRL